MDDGGCGIAGGWRVYLQVCRRPAGTLEQVLEWQEGNNQVLTLSSDDHPRLWIKDNWSGDPKQCGVYREKGESENKDARLINRVKKADRERKWPRCR